jgi:uncharacterized protein YjiS (DUF1127 family)
MATVVQSALGPQHSKCRGNNPIESAWLQIGMLNSVVSTIQIWMRRLRERRELAQMTELELQDIGMPPCDRWWRVNKPFWKE